jgi:hypothetical protein
MLLDSLEANDEHDIRDHIRDYLDHTATGPHAMSLEQMCEAQVAIANELAVELLKHIPAHAAWQSIINILRLLPWNIDPESAQEPSVYRYFGGLEYSSECKEQVFNTITILFHEGRSWGDIINFVNESIKVKSIS